MNEVLNFLKSNPVQFFATVGLDNKPKVRPFQFMLEKDGKLFFCTSNEKEVYKEIKSNPYVELCSSSLESVWVRLHGKVIFKNDPDIKSKILENNPLIKSIYQSPDNPIFEIFYLEGAEAVFYDFSGNPPKKYSL